MTSLSTATVKHVAQLANLSLTEEELKDFTRQLSETINYVNQLEEIDTTGIVPTPQVTGKSNGFRKDEITPGLTQEQALANAPKSHNGFFVAKISWS